MQTTESASGRFPGSERQQGDTPADSGGQVREADGSDSAVSGGLSGPRSVGGAGLGLGCGRADTALRRPLF